MHRTPTNMAFTEASQNKITVESPTTGKPKQLPQSEIVTIILLRAAVNIARW